MLPFDKKAVLGAWTSSDAPLLNFISLSVVEPHERAVKLFFDSVRHGMHVNLEGVAHVRHTELSLSHKHAKTALWMN